MRLRALLLLLAGPALAQVTITDKVIVRKTGRFHVDVHYPVTGNTAVDKLLDRRAWAIAAREDLQDATPDRPYSSAVSYKVMRNDAQMLSVQIESYIYTGGAHGRPDVQSYNFLMPDGFQVLLPELVDGRRGMARISELAKHEIHRRAASQLALTEDGEPDPDPDNVLLSPDLEKNIVNGAGPQALEHTPFVWKPDELVLSFEPYQVFGYIPEPDVHIPMTALTGLVRANPRAPLPSFDCAKAHRAIEKSICGSVALARLDRELAGRVTMAEQSYRDFASETQGQKYAADQRARLAKLVAGQKAWEAARDRVCAGGAVACLTASYTARMRQGF